MGKLIGLFIVLCIASHFANGKIDSARVKKWWGENDKNN